MKKITITKLRIYSFFFMVLLSGYAIVGNIINCITGLYKIDKIGFISTCILFVFFLSLLNQSITEYKKLKTHENN